MSMPPKESPLEADTWTNGSAGGLTAVRPKGTIARIMPGSTRPGPGGPGRARIRTASPNSRCHSRASSSSSRAGGRWSSRSR